MALTGYFNTLKKVGNTVATAVKNNNSNSNTSNKSTGGGKTTTPSGTVKTNTSYNGSYLDVDLGTDYQAKINSAVASGDYDSAAYYESLRNAKINYLNSVNGNTGNYQTSNNYVSNYGSNNNNGISYTSNYKDFSSLPTNWTTANINGATYKNDNGLISQRTGYIGDTPNYLVRGNGINPETGEWTFNNYDDAKRAAYNQYLGVVGGSQFGDLDSAYKYLDDNNVLGKDYIERFMNGTQGQYSQKLADEMYNKEQMQIREEKRKQALQSYYDEEYNSLNDDKKNVLDTNSFETDVNNYVPDYRYENDYYNYMKNLEKRRRMGVM